MRRWPVVLTTSLAFALILVLAFAAAAQPEGDFETEPEDSLAAGASDRGEDEEEEGGEGADSLAVETPSQGPVIETRGFSFWGDTHPDLSIKISRQKDVTNWDTKLALRERLSSRLSFNLSASLHTRENATLNRSDSNDGVTAGLRYKLSDVVALGVRYNSKVTAFRHSLAGKEPDDRKGKEELSVSAEFSRILYPGVDVKMSMNAGATKNAYASVSNTGSRKDLAASISYMPNSRLRSSVSYTAKSTLLDSNVDSSGVSVFSSTDESFAHDLAVNVVYDIRPGIKLSADASRNERKKEHPDPVRLEQETELRSARRASVSAKFDLMPRFTWDVSMRFNHGDTRFDLQKDRNNRSSASALSGSAKLKPWRGATVNLGGTRDVARNIYETPDTGDNVHESLSFKLTQDLGARADMNLTALSDITSVIYDNKDPGTGNANDRDRVNSRIAIRVNYKPLARVNTRFGGEYTDDQTVYTQVSKSWSNKTTRKFRISGSYDLKTFRDVGLKQDYDISAIYAFYMYGENRNTLVRNSNIATRVNVPLSRNVTLNVSHQYKFQDQGGYREEGGERLYSRSTERETNIMALNLRYVPVRYLKLSVRSSYNLQRNYRYVENVKILDYEIPTTELSGRASFNYHFGDRTKVSLSLEQNRREGPRVSAAFRNYQNIEFEASHVF